MIDQLALPIAPAPGYAADDFLAAASNQDARAFLADWRTWPGGRLALFGPPGSGKTHLARIWSARTGARLIAAGALRGAPPGAAPLAIEDGDRCVDEVALLHWLNAAAEAGQPVLLSGRTAPARWPTALPDLASRLRATTAIGIDSPDDGLLRVLLIRLLADRQLAVPEPVQEYLLRRLPRTPAALRDAAADLDQMALATGRPIGRALAAAVVAKISLGS